MRTQEFDREMPIAQATDGSPSKLDLNTLTQEPRRSLRSCSSSRSVRLESSRLFVGDLVIRSRARGLIVMRAPAPRVLPAALFLLRLIVHIGSCPPPRGAGRGP